MDKYIYNLGQAFKRQVQLSGNAGALVFGHGDMCSFTDLDALSNRLGRFLLAQGVSKGAVVCIFNSKSAKAFAVMVACLKIGVIYVNLDNTSPEERLRKIVATCRPGLIINDFEDALYPGLAECPVVHFSDAGTMEAINGQAADDLPGIDDVVGSDPAYIMFTSGSTGFPKGATMTHDNLLKFIAWGQERYQVTSSDIFTNVNPIYFDNSVFDFYISVFNGAAMAPVGADIVSDPNALVAHLNAVKPTIWFSVPSLLIYLLTMRALKDDDFESLRIISFGGEGFPKPKLKLLWDLFGERVAFVNVYGPTECTCICSSYDITDDDFKDMKNLAPLGRINPNYRYRILPVNDTEGPGELCLIGPHVGLGYYNDLSRTAASFIPDPGCTGYREIMYTTGDLVEEDVNGILYFKGRKDNQIKYMGYRIELEEIEAGLNTLPYVHEACVVYKMLETGQGQIRGFVAVDDISITGKDVLNDLKKIVPAYMTPKSIVVIEGALPKNKNGKIDRQALLEQGK